MEYLYFYRFKPHNGKYRNLFKKRFQVIIHGSMNSALVEFEGGQREVISGNAIRKIRNPKPVLSEAEVSDIPNHLKSAYQDPESAKKSDLAQLAVLLDIPLETDNPLKKDLLAAIEAYKEQPFSTDD